MLMVTPAVADVAEIISRPCMPASESPKVFKSVDVDVILSVSIPVSKLIFPDPKIREFS